MGGHEVGAGHHHRGVRAGEFILILVHVWAIGLTRVFWSSQVHEHNTGDTVQLLAVGAVAGVAYCRTRNLLASMAVHASFNLGVLVLFALWTHS
tara:strand:- start:124 stop:405 length:282 start_codon:yes stop_codon:yes gene_type:complete